VSATKHDTKRTFVLTECDHIYVMLRHAFEGIDFTENSTTIEADELEEEKKAKNS